MPSVKVGPKFFRNELNEYSSWRWAYIREALQNCCDAPGTDTININITQAKNHTVIVFENNGEPMDLDTLVNKLLALGESGKNFAGTVGGFGKAKTLLYLAHESYTIRTGTHEVKGCGGEYEITSDLPYFHGTRSEVTIVGEEAASLISEVKRFVAFAQWSGTITLNGAKLESTLWKGSPRKGYEWGTVYTNKKFQNRVIVRVDGIPMFHEYTSLDRTVIVELKGPSIDVLTSNRDSLSGRYRDEFQEFLTNLITNKSKALRAATPRYTHFSGAKYRHRKTVAARTSARDLVGNPGTAKERAAVAPTALSGSWQGSGACGGSGVVAGSRSVTTDQTGEFSENDYLARIQRMHDGAVIVQGSPCKNPVSTISEEFVLKNETTLKIPDYYQPDSDQFGTYSRKLARIWGRLLLELHRKYAVESEFAIGFIFSEDDEAEHEVHDDYGTVYYISPTRIVEQSGSASKSFKKRFALTERNRLLALAAHEFIHGLGFDSHSEDFACRLTDMMWEIMDDRKRFNWCFSDFPAHMRWAGLAGYFCVLGGVPASSATTEISSSAMM